jgi:hypothetical protein
MTPKASLFNIPNLVGNPCFTLPPLERHVPAAPNCLCDLGHTLSVFFIAPALATLDGRIDFRVSQTPARSGAAASRAPPKGPRSES